MAFSAATVAVEAQRVLDVAKADVEVIFHGTANVELTLRRFFLAQVALNYHRLLTTTVVARLKDNGGL